MDRENFNKHFSWIPALYIDDKINKNGFKLDDNLLILPKKSRAVSKKIIADYIQKKWRLVNLNSTFLIYKYKKERISYHEAEDRVRRFVTAIRIYFGKGCDELIGLSIGDGNNSRLMDYSDYSSRQRDLSDHIISKKEVVNIDNKKDLLSIKKIYKNLGIARVESFNYYSRLHNSLKFFEHAYTKDWSLLKVTLLFISLESIFGGETEIAYKVSTRSSFMLYPKDFLKRSEIFHFIKEGYKIRSGFVHGKDVEKDIAKIMKKIALQKKVESYDFHDSFQKDLFRVLSNCLKVILLDDKLTKLMMQNEDSIAKYLDELVIGHK